MINNEDLQFMIIIIIFLILCMIGMFTNKIKEIYNEKTITQ